jgi:ABC-type uncharacterized transport system substrate-binding protein
MVKLRMMLRIAATALALLALAAPAAAHPHVWVTMKTELVYGPDGAITGMRHAWTFDDSFSIYATQGIDQKTKGQFTREELGPLATENVTSLKEYDFFTVVRVDGARKKDVFADPTDYWLDYRNEELTLNFTLPLKTPIKAKDLTIEIFDPDFFVNFEFARDNSVALGGAPVACRFAVTRPGEADKFPSSQRLDKSFRASEANAGMGAQYASKLQVQCP